jgi:hypothetical protein
MTTTMTTKRSGSLALIVLLTACGGGGAAAPAPAAPQPATNAAGRPATREALADLVYGAFANNRPADLELLLPTPAELEAACPGLADQAALREVIDRSRKQLTESIATCREHMVWAGASRTALWGGHPQPPEKECPGLPNFTALDIDVQTTKGMVTLRVDESAQVAGGFIIHTVTCGLRSGPDNKLRALGEPDLEKEFEAYTNEVCGCKDMKCIVEAGTKYAEKHKNDRPRDYDAKPSKRMVELVSKMADCNKKIMEEEMKRAMPPEGDYPPPDGDDDEDW